MIRKTHQSTLTLAFTTSALLCAHSAAAATITGVTVEDFSSERTGFGGKFAVNSIDGDGFDSIAGTHDNARATGWQSDEVGGTLDDTPFITYDLGAVYLIDRISVWNYNHSSEPNNGYKDVVVTYGETTALGSTLTEVTTFAEAPGDNGYTGETFDSFTPFSARFIKFDATSNHGGARTGLAEVRFSAVPEPSTLALIGLGGLMIARRRRD